MNIIDFKMTQKWNRIPKHIRDRLIDNVFCSTCGVTTIVEYSMYNDKCGILLKGKCKKCCGSVARLIEDE